MKTAALLAVLVTLLALTAPTGAASSRILPVERQIASCGIEIGVGFDKTDRERWRVAGDENMNVSSWRQDGEIVLGTYSHNHPGEGRCVNLSYEDVAWAAGLELREVRATSSEGGRAYVAVLRNPRHLYDLPDDAFAKALKRNEARGWCHAWEYAWRELGFDYEVLR